MSFNIFSAGTRIKSSEVNDNLAKTLSAISDITLINEDMIKIMGGVNDFKIVDLFVDNEGSNKSVDVGNTTSTYVDNINTSEIYDNDEYFYGSKLELSEEILDPSFEDVTNWSYSEDDYHEIHFGEKSSSWKTDGSFSYKLYSDKGAFNLTNEGYCQISQLIDFTNINQLIFDYNISGGYFSDTYEAYCYIGDLEIFKKTNTGTSKYVYNTKDITGFKELKFVLKSIIGGPGLSRDVAFYIDNIKTNFKDSFIQSKKIELETEPKSVFINPKLLKQIPEGTEITHQISLDDGSTWSDEFESKKVFDISNLSGKDLLLKTHIKTDLEGLKTPKITGWSVMLF